MGIKGNLTDITVVDLIQLTCSDHKTAAVYLSHVDQQTVMYFKGGQVLHAISGDRVGEEVIFRAIGWTEGEFNVETGIEPPVVTIHREWMDLLLEGARRFDEENYELYVNMVSEEKLEEIPMAQKIEEILRDLSFEVNGYAASMVVGVDGIHVAYHSPTRLDPELASTQMTLLMKLVDTSAAKTGAGDITDNLVTTERAYLMMKYLPGKQLFLGVIADRKTGNIGNLRLMVKMYSERVSDALDRLPA